MIICDNYSSYAFDVSFIQPKGTLIDFIASSRKWATTTIQTLRNIQKIMPPGTSIVFFDDIIGNRYEEYIDITVVMYRDPKTNKIYFTMFKKSDVDSLNEYVTAIHTSYSEEGRLERCF